MQIRQSLLPGLEKKNKLLTDKEYMHAKDTKYSNVIDFKYENLRMKVDNEIKEIDKILDFYKIF